MSLRGCWWLGGAWRETCWCQCFLWRVCPLCPSIRFSLSPPSPPATACYSAHSHCSTCRNSKSGSSESSGCENSAHSACAMRWSYFSAQLWSTSADPTRFGTRKCTNSTRWTARLCSIAIAALPLPFRTSLQDSADRRSFRCRSAGRT